MLVSAKQHHRLEYKTHLSVTFFEPQACSCCLLCMDVRCTNE